MHIWALTFEVYNYAQFRIVQRYARLLDDRDFYQDRFSRIENDYDSIVMKRCKFLLYNNFEYKFAEDF